MAPSVHGFSLWPLSHLSHWTEEQSHHVCGREPSRAQSMSMYLILTPYCVDVPVLPWGGRGVMKALSEAREFLWGTLGPDISLERTEGQKMNCPPTEGRGGIMLLFAFLLESF